MAAQTACAVELQLWSGDCVCARSCVVGEVRLASVLKARDVFET